MSRTRKDSKQNENTVLEIVRRANGSFDLFLNTNLERHSIPAEWLNAELCVRFGFCGDEYKSIIDELTEKGIKTLVF